MEAKRLGRIKKSRLRSAYATFSFLLGYRVKVEWKKVLPKLMAIVTRHPRYLPEIEWASNSWTHNVFRVWELIFWRREGIKREMSSYADSEGNEYQIAHSFEACFALVETHIRAYLASWKFVPFKISVPVLCTPNGFPVFASPYLFAIALDTTTNPAGASGTSHTVAHTVTGSNPILMSYARIQNDVDPGPTPSSCTYAGAAMTATSTSPANNGHANRQHSWLFIKGACATGANNIVLTMGASYAKDLWSTSYSGAQASSTPDSTGKTENTGSVTNCTVTTTVVASNCWLFGLVRCEIGGGTAGTGWTSRYNNGDGGIGDSNGTVATGSQSMTYNHGSAPNAGIIVSFAPLVTTMTVSVSDQLNITDVVTIVNIKDISVSDQLNLTEAVTMLVTSFVNVSDQLNITESVTIFINPLFVSVSDQITVTDVLTIARFQETENVSVSDQLNVSESVQMEVNSTISVNDQVTITESVSTTLSIDVNVSDQLTVSESVTVGITINLSVSDQLNITESVTRTVSEIARGLAKMRGNDNDYPLGMSDQTVI